MTSGPQKGQALRIWFNGAEYVSVLGAAQMLGVSISTLKRWERKGLVERPAELPRGNQHTRWYSVEAIEALAAGDAASLKQTAKKTQASSPGASSRVLDNVVPASQVELEEGELVFSR